MTRDLLLRTLAIVALAATAPCLELKSVKIERVVDASTRRENLQKKVGAGLTTVSLVQAGHEY